ncbi:S41 family peptidase [Nafulsella turpanensis]|uniref:S41 family peptidase n=1 Tax=Nafulsella turpanensis TaxID=1265690 RepID=UPI000376D2D3|nr:S41 family peptidase [Nafulsella turpanensis]
MINNKNSKSATKMPLLVSIGVAAGILLGAAMTSSDAIQNSYSSVLKFRDVLSHIERSYVDEIDTEVLVEEAINGMLKKLDPHSVYIPKEDLKLAESQLEGEFEGIGVEFNLLKDTIYVVAPLSGGPSETAGIKAGDKIITVNGKTIAGTNLTNRDIFTLLRGPKGSEVELGIKRRGEDELINYTVVRDKIPQHSVAVSYMVNEEVGYIKLTRFSATTYDEFKAAMEELKEQGMEKLILDLQDNPGGYMDRAINIADEFISGNKMIVYTDGKRSRYDSQALAQRKGMFEEQPVIVLLNEGSASASEIVAGALQDNDRGLIVGRRSFGKGLVQMPIDLNDGSQLRLTISRYYTPSGRSIQKPYEEGDYRNDLNERYEHGEYFSADSIDFIDTLRYETRNGRVVYGGGGIMPDFFVPFDTSQSSTYLNKLFMNNVINEYTLSYAQDNRKKLEQMGFEKYYKSFDVSEQMLQQLTALGKTREVPFDKAGFAQSKELLRTHVKALIARSIWRNKGYYPIYNQTDEVFQEALKLFDEAAELASNE